MEDKLLRPKQVCEILNVSLTTLRTWSNEGSLGTIKLNSGHRRYLESDVLKILDQRSGKTNS